MGSLKTGQCWDTFDVPQGKGKCLEKIFNTVVTPGLLHFGKKYILEKNTAKNSNKTPESPPDCYTFLTFFVTVRDYCSLVLVP